MYYIKYYNKGYNRPITIHLNYYHSFISYLEIFRDYPELVEVKWIKKTI
jgi:hypothetical protein